MGEKETYKMTKEQSKVVTELWRDLFCNECRWKDDMCKEKQWFPKSILIHIRYNHEIVIHCVHSFLPYK